MTSGGSHSANINCHSNYTAEFNSISFLSKFEYCFVILIATFSLLPAHAVPDPPISPDVRGITCDVTSCLSGPHSYQKHSLTGHTNLISGSIIY